MDANDRGLVKFTALAHALFHTYELSIPLFIGVWMAEFDASAALVGTVVGAGYALVGLGAPVSGVLSDRLGSRRLITLSVVGMGGGFALVSLADGVFVLGVAVVVWGAFASLYHPAGLSLISRSADARGSVFAYHGAGGNVGTAFGPLATVVLLLTVEWQLAVGLLALPAFAAALVGLRIEFDAAGGNSDGDGGGTTETLGTELRRTVAESRALFGAAFTVAFVAVLLYGTYYRGLLTFLPDVLAESPSLVPVELFGYDVDPAQYVYTGLLTVGIGGQYAGGRLTDRVPSTTAFVAAFAVLAGLAFAFPVVRTLGVVPLVGVCLALGFVVYGTAPIYQVVIAEHAADDAHGRSYGFTYLAMFGVGAAGASVAGVVLTHATSAILFAVLGLVAAIGCGVVVWLRRL
ncbi:MFS transporter [Haloplanus aerogenes]|uniref:MFS transporter n=1 Tax=Haloplanus aerogenes TaxID=660522 RepID=A0A3M0CUC3_9EURY|nr:MFS transporter [Haloplanus aerogenes]AZH26756.1 MFS transporter [Haloplanus aerogenes]RMB13002.1 sugar phosphate permease [Haloplanus aerogenes]